MVARNDAARLERLLAWRRSEEEMARRREASALCEVEAARARLQPLTEELAACRDCIAEEALGTGELLDAQQCAARLTRRVEEQRVELESARSDLRAARAALAEAGRRRLAVERLVGARAVRAQEREQAVAQAALDESGRLRLLRGSE